MKKVFAVLAVVLMFSGMAFASPAGLIGLGGMPVQFTNLEENALLNPSLLGSFANKAVIGIAFPVPSMMPEAQGLAILKAGPGTLMVAAGPRSFGSVDFLDVNNSYGVPDSTFNLGYALDMEGLKAGLSVGYGVDNNFQKNLWAGSLELKGKDEFSTNRTALKIAAGVGLETLDAAISLSMPGYSSETKDFDNINNKLTSNPKTKFAGMDIAIDAKATVSEMILAVNATISSLEYQNTTWIDANVDGTPEVNSVTTNDDSSLDISLLAGKVIKATDNMTVTLGTGVKIATSGAYKSTTEDKVLSTKTTNNPDASSGMMLTIPFNLSVDVALGKLLTISNDDIGMTIGISKEAIVLNNYNNKTINTGDGSNNTLTDHSDLYNTTPVTGAVGFTDKLKDSKIMVSAGAQYWANIGSIMPVVAASFVYDWK